MSTYTVTVEGRSVEVTVKGRRGNQLLFVIGGKEYTTTVEPTAISQPQGAHATGSVRRSTPSPSIAPLATPTSSPLEIRAPMPGVVSDIKVALEQGVQPGETLIVIEAMKMENPLKASRAGRIATIHTEKGREVAAGALLITLRDEG
jgi:biotin carboxyl carrier protein